KRADLMKKALEISKIKDAYRQKSDPALIDKLIQLGAEQEALIAGLLSLSEGGPAKDISKKRDSLVKITLEIDDLLANPPLDVDDKLKPLQSEQEKLLAEIEMDEAQARGGTALFLTEPSKTDLTLLTTKEKESIKNPITKEKVEFTQGLVSDSLPIMGTAA